MKRPGGRAAFTLVELLVVIAIIGVLVALLLPAVQAAREAARRAQCGSQLKQIALAVLNFDSAKGRFPAGSSAQTSDINGNYFGTWAVDILPQMEQPALHRLWDPKVDFSHANNRRLRESFVPVYLCPSDMGLDQLSRPESGNGTGVLWAPGSYRAVSGVSPGTSNGDLYWDNPNANRQANVNQLPDWTRGPLHSVMLNPPANDRKLKPVSVKNISDGTSNTLMVGEYHTATNPTSDGTANGQQKPDVRRNHWAYAYTSYNQSSGIRKAHTLLPDYAKCWDLDNNIFNTDSHDCKRAWGSLHTGGFIQFARCDGSVTTIDPDIDLTLWLDMCTIQSEGATIFGAGTPGIPPR